MTTDIRYSWTQPICERDWIIREGEWEEDRLVSVRRPHLLVEPEVEQCSFCGAPTIFGAFVREDPKLVKYPAVKDD